jgi:hypothetical protein
MLIPDKFGYHFSSQERQDKIEGRNKPSPERSIKMMAQL